MNELPTAWLTIAATNNKLTEVVKRFIYMRFPNWSQDARAALVLISSMVIGIGATAFTEGAFGVFDGTFLAGNPAVAIVVVGITSAFGADALRAILSIKDLTAPKTMTLEAESLSVKSEPQVTDGNG